MTQPRHEIFANEEVGTYHCISRCVRRAFLCGKDHYSGNSYEHRREWMRHRLEQLLQAFAIELISYAVMSNHLHTLIKNRPDIAASWSAEEVATRWRSIFPRRRNIGVPAGPSAEEIQEITNDPNLVLTYRARLSSISWLNRCLCEYVARRANLEDKCTGRFWEGRFKSQRIFDVSGVIACSAYIDLNPIRARVAQTLEESDYTSIQARIREHPFAEQISQKPRLRLLRIEEISAGKITTEEYFSLVDRTGRAIKEGKGRIDPALDEILTQINIRPSGWLEITSRHRHLFKRVVGPRDLLRKAAKKSGKMWFHGLRAAAQSFGLSGCEAPALADPS